jgi:hypothetical protein
VHVPEGLRLQVSSWLAWRSEGVTLLRLEHHQRRLCTVSHMQSTCRGAREAFVNQRIPSWQDLDLVKLTAQFVARNGKGFLTDLAMKETRNQDFNFLKPTHSMFTFFTALCDSYSKVLMPPAGTSDKLRKDATDR